MEVTVECSRRLLDGDVSIVDTRRLFLKYSDGSSPIRKFHWCFITENFARKFYERVNGNEGMYEREKIYNQRKGLNRGVLSEDFPSIT